MKYTKMRGSQPSRQFPALYATLVSWGCLEADTIPTAESDNSDMQQLIIMGRNGDGVQSYSAVNGDFSTEIATITPDKRRAEIRRILRAYGRYTGIIRTLPKKWGVGKSTFYRDLHCVFVGILDQYFEADNPDDTPESESKKQARIKQVKQAMKHSADYKVPTKELARRFDVDIKTIQRDTKTIVNEALSYYLESAVDPMETTLP